MRKFNDMLFVTSFRWIFTVFKCLSTKRKIYVLVLLSIVHLVYSDCGLIDASYHFTPDLISIKYLDGNTETRSEAIFTCPRGYSLNGTLKTQCDGDWFIIEKPRCVEVRCPIPDEIPHGHIFFVSQNSANTLNFGSGYSVECELGYTKMGSHFRLCNENGSWSGEPNNCIRSDADCDLHDRIQNSTVHLVTNPETLYRYANKTVYYIMCDDGFHLNGTPVVECGAPDIPTCTRDSRKLNCPRMPHNIINGQLKLQENLYSNPIYYIECDDGYSVSGSSFIWCQTNGNWSTKPLCCRSNTSEQYIIVIAVLCVALCVCLIIIGRSEQCSSRYLPGETCNKYSALSLAINQI